jgi:hypothetical protein
VTLHEERAVSEPTDDFAALFEASLQAKRIEKGQTLDGTIVAIGRRGSDRSPTSSAGHSSRWRLIDGGSLRRPTVERSTYGSMPSVAISARRLVA